MKTVKEELKYATIEYPQLSKLPNGVYFVIQDGHKEAKTIDKYAAFLKSGKLFLIGASNSLKQARKNALAELNKQLRNVCLTWNEPTKEHYLEVFKTQRHHTTP